MQLKETNMAEILKIIFALIILLLVTVVLTDESK